MLRHHYVVTAAWVRSVLGAGLAWPSQLPDQASAGILPFALTVPFCAHGAIEASHAPAPNMASIQQVGSLFRTAALKGLARDASIMEGKGLKLRSGSARLVSDNPLSALFIPPAAGQTAEAVRLVFHWLDHYSRAGERPEQAAYLIFMAYLALLTIHPFEDGNGRTMRRFFAARILQAGSPDTIALLGMLLAHRGNSQEFHLATWAFRAGDPEPALRLFDSALGQADRSLGAFVAGLQSGSISPEEYVAGIWSVFKRS